MHDRPRGTALTLLLDVSGRGPTVLDGQVTRTVTLSGAPSTGWLGVGSWRLL
jgi:hypothetical protein